MMLETMGLLVSPQAAAPLDLAVSESGGRVTSLIHGLNRSYDNSIQIIQARRDW